MTPGQRMLWTTFADFVMSAGGIITGAMLQQGQVVMPNKGVLLLALVTGIVTAFSHVKASLARPPQGG